MLLCNAFAVAIFVFLAATARTWVVAPNFRADFDGVGALHALRASCGTALLVLSRIFFFVSGVFAIVVALALQRRLYRLRRRHRRRNRHVPAGLLRSCLRLYGDLASHQGSNGFGIHGIEHGIENFELFNFINHQRVFLFVACILNGLTQLVEFAQMLFPCFVDRH